MNLTQIYETLLSRYGEPHWWPTRSRVAGEVPYEVIVGAVLTQNCAWSNVEKALANFGERLSPDFVLSSAPAELIEIIRPAGFFNQKVAYLKAVTEWFGKYGFDVPTVRRESLEKLRAELLSTKGIGRETADAILLYAFGLPTFVIDAYTMRLCERLPIPAGNGYNNVKAYFESRLPRSAELFNNFHALIVINAKAYCRKKPLCGGAGAALACPLADMCISHSGNGQ
ncbi:MAG: endonuclease [Oscillospiraceae bacterium]|jgi:endonuclease-3 related protein|nr:endonuclease [Oscillospiraceae bacterium]